MLESPSQVVTDFLVPTLARAMRLPVGREGGERVTNSVCLKAESPISQEPPQSLANQDGWWPGVGEQS